MTKKELLQRIEQAAREQARRLDLNGQNLTELPPKIGQLTQLQELQLSGNHLTHLPPGIGQLTQLQRLNLYGNQLTRLPPEIGQLTQLKLLILSNNQLTQLPQKIGQLTQLRELYLSKNQLTQLPPEIGQLTQLRVLNLRDNPLPIPPEILNNIYQPAEILNYYFKVLKADSRPLHEAKMLLVGQGGVGKTSLVNRLLTDTYNYHESKTDGIAINQWIVTTPKNDKIRLNIWDFGGQEIMHATHQFFLTKRSLYLLVLDARQGEQESRVEYWLKLIQSFGGDSPVLVVINKIDEHRLDINCKGLRDKYPTIQDFFDISCKKGKGLDNLKKAIKKIVNELPHVHDLFPENWFKIKETLGNMQENYLSYDEYLEMCLQQGITDEISQRTLIGFLHDLGIVLNFRDDPSHPQLADTNILNPEWVTQGVYKLLNSGALAENRGVLEMSQLAQLLDIYRYPTHKQHLIVEIMEKFELCFAFDEQRQRFLIPELLPKEQPDFTWNDDDNLRFEYHYDVLPSSVISRFIVKVHEKIFNKTYWRTGVMLAMDNNQALVKADLEDKKIFIWVKGHKRGKRMLLGVIRSELSKIHQSISKIQAIEQVPYKEIVISYQYMLDLEELGEETFIPQGLKERVKVKELLEGIRKSQEELNSQTPQGVTFNYCTIDGLTVDGGHMTMNESKQVNTGGGSINIINSPGATVGIENVIREVTNSIRQLPDSDNKSVLKQLKEKIEQSDKLSDADKMDVLSQVQTLAEMPPAPLTPKQRSTVRVARDFLIGFGAGMFANLVSKFVI